MPRTSLWSRREFVKASSVAAIGAPYVITSAALGRGAQPAAGSRLTLGFIGMGIQNRHHLNSFLNRAECQVLAVCDVDTTRREHAAKAVDDKYGKSGASSGGCATYIDFRELLARQDIDAVVISTPDHWHGIQVIEACKAKKDIYCEKPLSLTIREAKGMIDAVRKHERVFQTGSQQRTENEGRFRTACEYVRNGRIGKLISVNVGIGESSVWCDLKEEPVEPGLDWDLWLGPAPKRPYNAILSPRGVHNHYPNWRLYREYSGGMMTDWGAHHYDIAQWGLKMDESGPTEIYPPRDEKAMHGARLVYPNGVEMFHGGVFGVTFNGTDGLIHVYRDRLISIPDKILKEPLTDKDERLPEINNHHDDWLSCVKSRKRPVCDIEVGARSVTVCHLANLAYWNRRPLKWDPKNWNFGADKEANGWMDYERRAPWALPEA